MLALIGLNDFQWLPIEVLEWIFVNGNKSTFSTVWVEKQERKGLKANILFGAYNVQITVLGA